MKGQERKTAIFLEKRWKRSEAYGRKRKRKRRREERESDRGTNMFKLSNSPPFDFDEHVVNNQKGQRCNKHIIYPLELMLFVTNNN